MTMSVQAIEAYNILKGKFTDEEAQKLVGYFESTSREDLATKADLTDLKLELKQETGTVRLEMAGIKVDLLKWVAGMLLAQAGLIAALVKLL